MHFRALLAAHLKLIHELGTVTQQHEAKNGHGTKVFMMRMVVWQLIYSAHLHERKQSWQSIAISCRRSNFISFRAGGPYLYGWRLLLIASWQTSFFYTGWKKMIHPKKTETSNDFGTIMDAHVKTVRISPAASKFLILHCWLFNSILLLYLPLTRMKSNRNRAALA